MKINLLPWLPRKKKGLGVGFIDMLIHAAPKEKGRQVAHKDPNWQEIFLPKPDKKVSSDKKISRWAAVFLGLGAAIVLITILGRLWQLEVIQGKASLALSEENRIRIRTIPAPRGVIYDRNGNVLATNTPGFRLVAETTGLTDKRMNEIADKLSVMLAISAADIKSKLKDQSQSEEVIESKLARDTALSLEVSLSDLPELRVVEDPIRSYPNGGTLAHLLGYVGEITAAELKDPQNAGYSPGATVGRVGVEASYDYLLRGKDGRELVEVDSTGRTARVIAREDPIPGHSLVLTVDLGLTKKVEEAMQQELNSVTHSRRAVAIAMDPRDGSLLTYLSYPTFDPNLFARGISTKEYAALADDPDQPLFDRAISGVYPPGSTFKPTVAVAALSEGVTTKDRIVNSPGVIYLGTQAFHNWSDKALGPQTLTDAIAWSNDIYFYTMGGELGVDRLSNWAAKFGFGQKTGIKIPGESKGNLPTAAWKQATYGEPWYPGDNYNYGIGQGFLLTTPMQMVSDIAAIGNGGTLFQPILIKEVRDENNFVISSDSPVVRKSNLASPDVISAVKDGMHKACTTLISFPGDVGCKTGTAEFGGSGQNPHGWFSIYAPLNNPQIAMVVLVEGVGHGSIYASPIARPAFTSYLTK